MIISSHRYICSVHFLFLLLSTTCNFSIERVPEENHVSLTKIISENKKTIITNTAIGGAIGASATIAFLEFSEKSNVAEGSITKKIQQNPLTTTSIFAGIGSFLGIGYAGYTLGKKYEEKNQLIKLITQYEKDIKDTENNVEIKDTEKPIRIKIFEELLEKAKKELDNLKKE